MIYRRGTSLTSPATSEGANARYLNAFIRDHDGRLALINHRRRLHVSAEGLRAAERPTLALARDVPRLQTQVPDLLPGVTRARGLTPFFFSFFFLLASSFGEKIQFPLERRRIIQEQRGFSGEQFDDQRRHSTQE